MEGLRARNIRIDLAVQGHDAFDRAHRQIRLAAQTPDPKAPGIGMALLQMINLQHDGEPYLPRRGMRRGTLVREAGAVVALEARNPAGDRRAGDVQHLTDTAFTPALRIQGDDLPAGLGALAMTVVVEERPRGRRRGRQAVPEAARGLAGEAIHGGMKNDPRQFAGAKPRIEPFEPLEFLHHALGHPELAARRADLLGGGHQAEHALLGKTAREAPDRFRMAPGFLRALRRGALRVEEQRADEFIPLLRRVAEQQGRCVSLRIRLHHGSLPAVPPADAEPESDAHGTAQAAPPRMTESQAVWLRPSSRALMK